MRARIDISEIEAQTKIRAKYLRALENEEWDLLPGPTFVKSFLRTYGQALGLDGKMLVEEYRQNYERPNESALEPIVSKSSRPQGAGRRGAGGRRASSARSGGGATGPSRGYLIAIAAVSVLIVVLVVALLAGGSSPKNSTTTTGSTANGTGTDRTTHRTTGLTAPPTTQAQVVSLSLQPTGPIFVCLLGDGGRRLIPGATLEPGSIQPTFHARHFALTLGNNAVKLYIDGSLRVVPPSSKPIGYSITKAGGRHTLTAAQQPTCK